MTSLFTVTQHSHTEWPRALFLPCNIYKHCEDILTRHVLWSTEVLQHSFATHYCAEFLMRKDHVWFCLVAEEMADDQESNAFSQTEMGATRRSSRYVTVWLSGFTCVVVVNTIPWDLCPWKHKGWYLVHLRQSDVPKYLVHIYTTIPTSDNQIAHK